MRSIRFAIAALIALGLAVLPMSAGLAMAPAAASQASMDQMDMGQTSMDVPDEGCACCNTAPDATADMCNLACCAAILAGEQSLATPRSVGGADAVAAGLSPFSPPPDPPPPRS